jgi:hypothetical protein
MKRYKSKYGVVYEIAPDGESGGYLLRKMMLVTNMIKRKSVTTEKMQTYLRSSREDCLKYMLQCDVFDAEELNDVK